MALADRMALAPSNEHKIATSQCYIMLIKFVVYYAKIGYYHQFQLLKIRTVHLLESFQIFCEIGKSLQVTFLSWSEVAIGKK